jgi:hypothetical protein
MTTPEFFSLCCMIGCWGREKMSAGPSEYPHKIDR